MNDIFIAFSLGCIVGAFLTIGILALVSIDKEDLNG